MFCFGARVVYNGIRTAFRGGRGPIPRPPKLKAPHGGGGEQGTKGANVDEDQSNARKRSRKGCMSLSALIVPLLLLAAGVGFLLLLFSGTNVSLMEYNLYRITQARDEQVEVTQDQSMKGCSQKRVR